MQRPTCQTCPYFAAHSAEKIAKQAEYDAKYREIYEQYGPITSPPHALAPKDGYCRFLSHPTPPVLKADFCGRHPDFPSFLAERPAELPKSPMIAISYRADDAQYGFPSDSDILKPQ